MKKCGLTGAALEIKIWMMRHGITGRAIAKEYGCKEPVVSQFLRGKFASKGLTSYVKKLGCPDKYFRNGRVAVPEKSGSSGTS